MYFVDLSLKIFVATRSNSVLVSGWGLVKYQKNIP
ncbi:hypothetical protein HOR65_gp01 [Staphylococcus phage St 134]|uniref:Uncharacterized protein n=1 Tax=Staphylococcus phage St 134 TaxID=1958922 RepID=A0A1S6KVD2_9CAUD|nr:hypothetical protein HOR65_gp01 [Staphylococcus phage St 134]